MTVDILKTSTLVLNDEGLNTNTNTNKSISPNTFITHNNRTALFLVCFLVFNIWKPSQLAKVRLFCKSRKQFLYLKIIPGDISAGTILWETALYYS